MRKNLKNVLFEIYYKFRSCIDNENYLIPEFREKNRNDKFVEKVEFEIIKRMTEEAFRYECNKIIIPTSYTVLISEEENKNWWGIKRDKLQQRLDKFIEYYLKMLLIESYGNNLVNIETSTELKGEDINVSHHWEEIKLPEIHFSSEESEKTLENMIRDFSEDTIITSKYREEFSEIFDDDFETLVGKSLNKLYTLEIWRDKHIQNNIPIYQSQILLGRGSPSLSVDIPLSGDLEISRRHAILRTQTINNFHLQVIGRNPIVYNQNPIFQGQTISFNFGEQIEIGCYSLSLRK